MQLTGPLSLAFVAVLGLAGVAAVDLYVAPEHEVPRHEAAVSTEPPPVVQWCPSGVAPSRADGGPCRVGYVACELDGWCGMESLDDGSRLVALPASIVDGLATPRATP